MDASLIEIINDKLITKQIKYENINPNSEINYNADYLHVVSDNKISTDI